MVISSFQGKNNIDAYLEWERKVELIFNSHNYSEEKKVKLITIKFTNYTIVWWNQFTLSSRRNRERLIDTWGEMKRVMKRRVITSHYYRELYQHLQNLTQGSKSVEDYHKEMKIAMIKTNIEKNREATMAKFLARLNHDTWDVVKWQHYVELKDLVHFAMNVEKQIQRKDSTRHGSSSWRPNARRKEDKAPPKPRVEESRQKQLTHDKGSTLSKSQRRRDIKCFRCLGNRSRCLSVSK